jgi:hypothetical protein
MSIRAIIALAAFAPAAAAGITFDEAVDGDLSNDRTNPNVFALGSGTNLFTMDVVDSNNPTGDLDYFTVTVGAGFLIDSITLVSSTNPNGGFDPVAFIAMQIGPEVTVDPAAPNPAPLAGFVIGDPGQVGTDILPALSGSFGPTLGEGQYAFWVQQTGTDLTRVTLSFNVVPAPASAAALGCLGLFAARRRR